MAAHADPRALAALGRLRRRPARDRPRRAGICFRQRSSAPPRVARRLRNRLAPRDARRLPRVHRGPRLPAARALALGRLGSRARPRVGGAGVLAAPRRTLAHVYAARRSACGSKHADLSRQLLRGGGVRTLGRRPPADRGGVGNRRARRGRRGKLRRERGAAPARAARRPPARHAGAGVRRRVGMDTQRLRPLSGLPPRCRGRRRIQRQVHVAASTCCAAGPAPRRQATSAPPTATSSRPTPAGSSPGCAWRNSRLQLRAVCNPRQCQTGRHESPDRGRLLRQLPRPRQPGDRHGRLPARLARGGASIARRGGCRRPSSSA